MRVAGTTWRQICHRVLGQRSTENGTINGVLSVFCWGVCQPAAPPRLRSGRGTGARRRLAPRCVGACAWRCGRTAAERPRPPEAEPPLGGTLFFTLLMVTLFSLDGTLSPPQGDCVYISANWVCPERGARPPAARRRKKRPQRNARSAPPPERGRPITLTTLSTLASPPSTPMRVSFM